MKTLEIVTNLAYVIAGVALSPKEVGVCLVLLGISSGIAHYKRQAHWWALDQFAIMIVLCAMLPYPFELLGVVVAITYFGLAYSRNDPLNDLGFSIIGVMGISAYLIAGFPTLATLIMIVALLTWLRHDLHWLWHILSAISLYLINA